MKAQCIQNNKLTRQNYFLFLIVPLLIGLALTLWSPLAQAKWENLDPPALHSPTSQGWVEIDATSTDPSLSLL